MKLFQKENQHSELHRLVLLNALSPAHCVDAGHLKVGFLAKSTPQANRWNISPIGRVSTIQSQIKVARLKDETNIFIYLFFFKKGEVSTGRNCSSFISWASI